MKLTRITSKSAQLNRFIQNRKNRMGHGTKRKEGKEIAEIRGTSEDTVCNQKRQFLEMPNG